MKSTCEKGPGLSAADSISPYVIGHQSWGASTESNGQQSSASKSLSLKIGVQPQHSHNSKLLTFQFQDQDSTSSQSTAQSYPEVGSAQSVYYGTQGQPVSDFIKSVSARGTQDFSFPLSQMNQNQPIAHIAFHHAKPYFGGLLGATYGPQATIYQSQVMGIAPVRVPLPLDLTEAEPIYVNAKQYHAILRRRQYRAKVEAQKKLIRGRKPYLHESRHLHALKRARGSGGRFLNTKKPQESKLLLTSHGLDVFGCTQLHPSRNMSESEASQLENYKDGASTTSCSDVTSVSNSDYIFQHRQSDFRFSGYPSGTDRSMLGNSVDMHGGGNQHRISVLM
ncbi:Nuclear transcription factor Y subunit A-3 [Quillaja saponaria]|uniref:Nuclear transcription factor Y subunit n=1 Tax=Quillaja saponaria TaxID=32244 RepID=A0AAD7LTR6_QUISA|nr:Nuclear transcription factor Y subunit A-3 [Quillaja saponaria]KAJ7963227.1 Nuclear transcription factor Y subunit A-3 [Quillaja saponaria]